MSRQAPTSNFARRGEAERLIELARAMLTDPSEEMTVIYLDHAIETLRVIESQAAVRPLSR